MCPAVSAEPRRVVDTDLVSWYQSDWLSANLRTVVESITLPEPVYVCDSDSKPYVCMQ